jgi:serine/threonine protein kinase
MSATGPSEELDDGTVIADQDATVVAPIPVRTAPSVGTVLRDRFVLEEVIGKGGMSVVYRALDRRRVEANDQNDHVAIKVLGSSFKDHPDAFIALQREARRAQTLAHPNIATVYDFDRQDDTPYLCMELLIGKTLSQLIKQQIPLSQQEIQKIIRGMSDGLDYAHGQGIVHADLKPANVFITDQGEVKLLDFGIARVVPNPDGGRETTFDGGRLGALTPDYASNEMFEGRPADPRDDVYALACVSYHLLGGAHPFNWSPAPDAREAGLTPEPIDALSAMQNEALKQGLAFERAARTSSAGDFYHALFPDVVVGRRRKGGFGWYVGVGLLIAVGVTGWKYLDPVSAGRFGSSEATPAEFADPPPQPQHSDAEQAVTLDGPTQARVERILDIAGLHHQMGKLVDPPGTNAAEAYAEVIRLDPGNSRALTGLTEVNRAVAEEASSLAAMGEIELAREIVGKGLAFQPENQELLNLRSSWTSAER